MLTKLDVNNDGNISKAEFVAGKPGDVSSDQAGSLFDTLDSGKTGSMSQADLLSAFQQMGSPMQSALIQAQSDSSTSAAAPDTSTSAATTKTHHGHGHHGGPDAAKMFSSLDSDGDGTVSKAEFVAGAPQGVSSDQAGAFFDKISNGNGDSLTKDQFVSGLKAAGPPDRDGDDTASSTSSSSSASSADPGALLDQLLAMLQGSAQAGTGATGGSPPDPSTMFSSLDSDGDGSVSKAEFVAGKPQGASSEQAGAFFDKISNGNGDSLTKDQFVSGLTNAGPPNSTEVSATAANDPGQILDQLLASGSSAASTSATSASTLTDGLTTAQTDAAQLLDQFIRAVGSYQNTAFNSRLNPASQASSALLTNAVAA